MAVANNPSMSPLPLSAAVHVERLFEAVGYLAPPVFLRIVGQRRNPRYIVWISDPQLRHEQLK